MKKLLLNPKSFVITFVIANLFLFSSTVFAQITSTATGGNWATPGTWVGGVVPTAAQNVVIATTGANSVQIAASITQTGSVTVNSGATLNATTTGVTVIIGSLQINGGGSMTMYRDFTVSGGTQIAGTINFGSTSGTNRTMTFTGDVVLNSGANWNETATGAVADFSFGGNFTNNATTFTAQNNAAAIHIFAGAGKVLSGTTASVIPYVTISGATTNNGTLTVASALAGASTLTNGATGTLNYGAAAAITPTITATAVGNTVNYTGAAQTGKVTTYHNLTLSGSGAKTFATTPTVNGTLSLGGTATVSVTGAGVITYGANATLQYNKPAAYAATAEEWITPFAATGGVIIANTGAITMGAAKVFNAGVPLTINSGAILTPGANLLTLGGNFINAGTLTSGAGGVTINGTSTQSIDGFTTTGLVTLNNATGATLNGNTSTGTLTLTTGILNISAGSTLTVTSGSAIGGGAFGAAKHINTLTSGATQGFIRVNNMAVAAAYTFPVGNSGSYLPVVVTPTGTLANNIYTVGVFTGATQNGVPNGTPITNKTNIVDAVYTVNYGGAGAPTAPSTTLNLSWPAGLEGAGFTALTNTQIGISHFDNPAWGNYDLLGGTADNSTNTATRLNVTTFSPFSVGKLGPAGGTLAVSVYYFNAAKGNGYNTLNWSAACSSDQVTFDIERSADGRNFSTINSITATRLQCAQPFDYVDNGILTSTVYYRIKIVDMNGKISYTSVVRVTNQQNDIKLVGVLPNPVTNSAVLNIVTAKKDNVQLWVVSMDGKLVQRSNVQLQPGSSIINLDVTNLQAGMYTIKGTFSDGQTSAVKFVKQ